MGESSRVIRVRSVVLIRQFCKLSPCYQRGGVKQVVPVFTSSPKMIAGHLWRGFKAILDIAGCISFMVGQEVGKGKPPRPARYTCAMARGLALPPTPPFPAGIAPSMPKQGTGAIPAVATLRLPSASLT